MLYCCYSFHFCRLLWVAVVTGASAGAISLSLSNWNRYSANPTVVSLRKDFRNWNNVFPSATACFLKRVDEKIANTYIKEYFKFVLIYTDLFRIIFCSGNGTLRLQMSTTIIIWDLLKHWQIYPTIHWIVFKNMKVIRLLKLLTWQS